MSDSQEVIQEEVILEKCCDSKKYKSKRDIFHFKGTRQVGVDLGKTTHMDLEGNKITFYSCSEPHFVELEDETAAESVFMALMNLWAGE